MSEPKVVDCRETFTAEYVTRLEAQLAEAREVLRLLEERAKNWEDGSCMVCTHLGHAPDCRLAKCLGEK